MVDRACQDMERELRKLAPEGGTSLQSETIPSPELPLIEITIQTRTP